MMVSYVVNIVIRGTMQQVRPLSTVENISSGGSTVSSRKCSFGLVYRLCVRVVC